MEILTYLQSSAAFSTRSFESENQVDILRDKLQEKEKQCLKLLAEKHGKTTTTPCSR